MEMNDFVKEVTDKLLNKIKGKINEETDNLKVQLTDYLYSESKQISDELKDKVSKSINDFNEKKNQIELLSKNKIVIDVGGICYTTSRNTLTKYKNSKLAKLFSGDYKLEYDNDGKIFIDRNGKYFEYILDSLRDEELVLPSDESMKNSVIKELKFFELDMYFMSNIEEFSFDTIYRNSNIVLKNNNLTVGTKKDNSHSSALGNIEMTNGIYTWEFYTDYGGYWIGLGVADINDISKDYTNDYSYSFMISTNNQKYMMTGNLSSSIGNNETLICKLDFERDEFTIMGNNTNVKNEKSIKNKKLRVIVNVFTEINTISVKNFKKVK